MPQRKKCGWYINRAVQQLLMRGTTFLFLLSRFQIEITCHLIYLFTGLVTIFEFIMSFSVSQNSVKSQEHMYCIVETLYNE